MERRFLFWGGGGVTIFSGFWNINISNMGNYALEMAGSEWNMCLTSVRMAILLLLLLLWLFLLLEREYSETLSHPASFDLCNAFLNVFFPSRRETSGFPVIAVQTSVARGRCVVTNVQLVTRAAALCPWVREAETFLILFHASHNFAPPPHPPPLSRLYHLLMRHYELLMRWRRGLVLSGFFFVSAKVPQK